MPENALSNRPTPTQTRASDAAVWSATHLRVRDLAKALDFWRDLLGLQVQTTTPTAIGLGVDNAELIVLRAGATRPTEPQRSGLYHVALHLPSAGAFADMLARLLSRDVDPRPTDHLLHWAMYLWDDDGIGVELSFETADRFDHVLAGPRPVLVATDGTHQSAVSALDVRPLLASVSPFSVEQPMPPGTRVGHNHLHVGDLSAASAFYELVGFVANPPLMNSMEDFNAGGSFPHRLAINEWQGRGALPARDEAAGLDHLSLVYRDDAALRHAVRDLQNAGHPVRQDGDQEILATDPAGNVIELGGPGA